MKCNIVKNDRLGVGPVIFWGGICYDRRTELYRVDRGSQTSHCLCGQDYLEQEFIDTIDWPAR